MGLIIIAHRILFHVFTTNSHQPCLLLSSNKLSFELADQFPKLVLGGRFVHVRKVWHADAYIEKASRQLKHCWQLNFFLLLENCFVGWYELFSTSALHGMPIRSSVCFVSIKRNQSDFFSCKLSHFAYFF